MLSSFELALQPHEDTKDGQAVIQEIYLQHSGRTKWENARDAVMSTLKTKWNSSNTNKTLTNHIATYWVNLVDVKRCCKRTERSRPTVREQVLWMVGPIITVNPLLTAHIAQINGDPLGLGMNFEGAAMYLMLADPIEKDKIKRERSGNLSIYSALAGRGETSADLRWYNRDEFKLLDQNQKDELFAWRTSAKGKAAVEANKTKLKVNHKTNKQKREGGGGNSGGGRDKVTDEKVEKAANRKLQKKSKRLL